MRRSKPELLVATLLLLLLGWYVWYTHSVIEDLRADARRTSDMYARVFHAFADTSTGAETQALLGLARSIREQGVPLILTDHKGDAAGHANLPFDTKGDTVPNDDPRVRAYIDVLAEAASADRRLVDRQDLLRRSAGGERASRHSDAAGR